MSHSRAVAREAESQKLLVFTHMALLVICGAPLVIKPVVMQSEQRAVQQ
jgi:hypothetical protein